MFCFVFCVQLGLFNWVRSCCSQRKWRLRLKKKNTNGKAGSSEPILWYMASAFWAISHCSPHRWTAGFHTERILDGVRPYHTQKFFTFCSSLLKCLSHFHLLSDASLTCPGRGGWSIPCTLVTLPFHLGKAGCSFQWDFPDDRSALSTSC